MMEIFEKMNIVQVRIFAMSMMLIVMFGGMLFMSGCINQAIRSDAEAACTHLQNTPDYGACYAQAYENSSNQRHAALSAMGQSMTGIGYGLYTQPQMQVCQWVGTVLVCN